MSATRRPPRGGVRALGALVLSTAMIAAAGAAEVGPTVFETVPSDEARQIDRLAEIIVELQKKRFEQDTSAERRPLRGVHPKSHGCVRADFTVNSHLREEDRVGLLAHPGKTYQAWIRFSNAAALIEDDLKLKEGPGGEHTHGSRGMALKVLDVEGEMLDSDGGRHNQDFLMINTPEFAFPDTRNYLRLNEVLLRSKNAADPLAFFAIPRKTPRPGANDPEWGDVWVDFSEADGVSTLGSLKVIQKIEKQVVRNPLQVQYFGAAPFLFGLDRAMKVSAKPCQKTEQAAFTDVTKDNPSSHYLRAALTETMRGSEAVCFDFQIDVRSKTELKEIGLIEDATTVWPDELKRYRSVARINIPAPQALDSAEAIEHCERLAFAPWHSLAAHQPIGGINRLRQKVYQNSAKHRGADGY